MNKSQERKYKKNINFQSHNDHIFNPRNIRIMSANFKKKTTSETPQYG